MRRLGISLLVVVLLATIGFGWTLDRLFIELQPDEADRLAPYRTMGEALAGSVNQGSDLDALTLAWPTDSRVQVGVMDIDELSLPGTLQLNLDQGETLALEADSGVTLIIPIRNTTRFLTLSLPPQTSAAEALLRIALTVLFYAGIVTLILLWVYPLVRRLHALSKAANDFGEGNLAARVKVSRLSLIKNIESEFNAMADRISALVDDNRLLSNAVSHDLRTPIARLRFGLDALSEESNRDVQIKYMQRISNDLAEMEHLVEVLLDYARLEKQRRDLPLAPMRLSLRVTDRIDAMFNDSSINIEWEEPEDGFWIMGNERYLDMVINNVLQNAQRYGKSRIRVSIRRPDKSRLPERVDRRTDKRTWLMVEDDGPGIAMDERTRVIKPFERGSANLNRARNASSSGFGMGLAIVDRILDWHGAELKLGSSSDLGGACVSIGLRAIDKPAAD